MRLLPRLLRIVFGVLTLVSLSINGASAQPVTSSNATSVTLGGVDYLHRWSKAGQHEFTPRGQEDLDRWRDMVTIDVHQTVGNGEQLADLANRVLGNYQGHGKIVRTDSRPRTPQRPAEHLIVALLGNPSLIEAAFARVVLLDGTGVVVVYSHRLYGKDVGNAMGDWLQANGPTVERTLMSWDGIPAPRALKQLPQAK